MVRPNTPSQKRQVRYEVKHEKELEQRAERRVARRDRELDAANRQARRPRANPPQRPLREAVVTQAIRTINRAPKLTSSANSCRVVHREMFHTVIGLGTSTGFNVRQPINPGNEAMFPWLSRVAQNYESYLFKRLRFEFITTAPTTVSGSVTMAVDYDPTDPAPNDANAVRALNAFIGAETAPIYTPKITINCRPANLHKRKSYFVSNTPGPDIAAGPQPVSVQIGSRDRSSDTGQFISAVVGPEEPVGLLFVEYDVDLLTPHYARTTGDAITLDIPYPDASSPPGPQITTPNHMADSTIIYNQAEEPGFPWVDYGDLGVSSVLSGKWADKSNSDNTNFQSDGMSFGYGTASSQSASGNPERFIQFAQPGFYMLRSKTLTFPATTTTSDDALSVPMLVNYDDNDNQNYTLKDSVGASFLGNTTINGNTMAQVGSTMTIAVEHPLSRMFLRQVTKYNRVVAPTATHFTYGVEWSLVRIGGLSSPLAAAIATVGTYGLLQIPYLIQALRRQAAPTPSPLMRHIALIHTYPKIMPTSDQKEPEQCEPSSFESYVNDIEEVPRKLLLLGETRVRKIPKTVL